MLQWLAGELATQQKKVQATEAALADYRDKQNALSLDDKQNIVLSRLNKLNDDVVGAKTRKAQKEVLYSQIKGLTPAELGKASAIAQNVQVAAAQARVQEMQAERVRLAQRYGEKHPDLLKAAANVQEAERVYLLEVSRAAQAIKNEYDTTVLEEQTYAQNLNAAKADAQDLSKKSVNYNLMEREANSNRQVHQALLQRENELRVSSNSRANNVRIVDNAEVPKSPDGQGQRSWPLGVAFGLVLAVAVPFMLDYINDTIKTPEDVARHLNVPFLGLVPSVRGDKYPLLASSHVPHDFGEAFRSLRTSLLSQYERGGHEGRALHECPAARRQDDNRRQHGDGARVRGRPRAGASMPTCDVRAYIGRFASRTIAASRRCWSARRAFATSFSARWIRICWPSQPARFRRTRRSCSRRSG